ncbi:acetate--CoA ligase family protein [Aquamicrobium sp. LC103]|uniref:acetate--CoA ligase family protein n=1 Tax=Aquamicrobium sp. LC103 TaxID=1120658 RepID=UPI00063EB61C|nr:acetate--CoA ligase family protein [Aquamicrobium sp. LC103]TKT74795.1 acetate--CoA ligase family protein [Aquamicrobium sp. LC103]
MSDAYDFSSINYLLNPASVAVIGASADRSRIGGRPIWWMLEAGFNGAIYPVNPNRREIQGLEAYPSIEELPETPEAAIVAVPAPQVADTLRSLGRRGCRAAVVFSSGFAEMGSEGAAAQAELASIAREFGLRMLGPNSLGMFNARCAWFPTFTTTFESGWPLDGGVSIVSQSGAFGSHLATLARNAGIGAPLCVMTGNEADVSVGEVIGCLAADPNTRVIAAYMEGIKNGRTLMAGLAAAREAGKPVFVMKVGRSRLGAQAAASHTASIAGDDKVADAIFEEFGAIRVQSADQLLDFARVAAHGIYPAPNRLGVLTVSGGAGVLMSDAADERGVSMPEMPSETQRRLQAVLPFASFRNPVDCTAHIVNDSSLLHTCLEAMTTEADYSSIIAFFAQVAGTESFGKLLYEELSEKRRRFPHILIVLVAVLSRVQARRYEEIGVAVFEDADRAVAAVAAMGRIGASLASRATTIATAAAPEVVLPKNTPSEAEAKRLLAAHGIAFPEEQACASAEEAVAAAERIGYPLVLKILSPDIHHKTEIGGVLLGVVDAPAVREGYATLMERARRGAPGARIEGVLVARQVAGGTEAIMGIKHDPVFGPIAVFGPGGIFTELMDDSVLRRCPFSEMEARAMIERTRMAAMLKGARGKPPADIDAAAKLLSSLSRFAAGADARLAGIDLNPVVILEQGKGALALDALVEVVPAP